MRLILWLHRYLAVAIGVLMALWCLSGFVMMYQGWPSVDRSEQLRGLTPLALSGECCALAAVPLSGDTALASFSVEMLADTPVLRTPAGAFDLTTGAPLAPPGEAAARAVARAYAAGNGAAGDIARFEALDGADQWTIQDRRAAPFWKAVMDDPGATWVYVSQSSGEVVQALNGRERFWTWLGAVPHWLYPRLLRQHSGTWFQVVVWTSALGVFLTLTGLYIGIAQFRRRPNGRWSPYRKLWLWHHYTGLVFGVLTLTWVFSGLLTMGPFWPMQSPPFPEARDINRPVSWAQARSAIGAVAAADLDGAVRIEAAPLGGQAYALVQWPDGRTLRLDANGDPAPVTADALAAALDGAGGPLAGAQPTLQDTEDAYYYAHHGEAELPVWRVAAAGPHDRVLYISAASGQVLRVVDNPGRVRRWLVNGLHSLDFPGLRARPVWDVVVLPLLGGVTLLCLIGVWLAWRRVKRDAHMLNLRLSKPRPSLRSGQR